MVCNWYVQNHRCFSHSVKQYRMFSGVWSIRPTRHFSHTPHWQQKTKLRVVYTCNARSQAKWLLILYHTPRCELKHQQSNSWIIDNVTLIFDCLLLSLCDDLYRVHAERLHVLPPPLLRRLYKALTVAWKIKWWVIMWRFCEHGVGESQVWVSIAQFVNSFITTTLCTNVHSEDLMWHFLNRRVGMGFQGLNFPLRTNYLFKIPRMHAWQQREYLPYSKYQIQ